MTGRNSAASSVSPLKPSDETLDIRQLENGLERSGARSPATTAPLASLAGIDALVKALRHRILGAISAIPETENTSECQEDIWLSNQDSNHRFHVSLNFRPSVDIDDPAAKADYAKDFMALLGALDANLPPPGAGANDEELLNWLKKLREPWLKLLKCPDFVVNRGHYFGAAKFNETGGLSEHEKSFGPEPVLSDDDKRALMEFLKTF